MRSAVDAYARTALVRAAISWRRRSAVRHEHPTAVLPEPSDGASVGSAEPDADLEMALRRLRRDNGLRSSCASTVITPKRRPPTPWVAVSATSRA
jgi:hypothetical protein